MKRRKRLNKKVGRREKMCERRRRSREEKKEVGTGK